MRPQPYTKTLMLLAKIALTVGAFWLVVRHMDVAFLQQMLMRQDHVVLVLVALLGLAQFALGAWRWRVILTALDAQAASPMRFKEAFYLSYVGTFFNCCLPGTIGGDVVRVFMCKSLGLAVTPAIHSVVIDRMVALVALGLLILAMLPLLAPMVGLHMALIFPLALAGMVLGLVLLANLHRLLKRFASLRGVKPLLYFASNVRLLMLKPGTALGTTLLSVVTHMLYCLNVYLLARSLDVAITPLQCLVLVPPVILATVLPLSIGGWGLREVGMVGMLALAGVASTAALAISVQMGLIGILVSLPGGIVWLCRRRAG